MPKFITHERRLSRVNIPLKAFIKDVSRLGRKLGCILIQLPPSFAFNRNRLERLLETVRNKTDVDISCEPRHESWFTINVNEFLIQSGVTRVAADPSRFDEGASPGGDSSFCDFRLHGSPRRYYSNYTKAAIKTVVNNKSQVKTASASGVFMITTQVDSLQPTH
jgi:uncharacterized protein YecE (DUF72 family)